MQWRLKKIWPVVATCILATNFTHADLDTSLIPNLENCPAAVDLEPVFTVIKIFPVAE